MLYNGFNCIDGYNGVYPLSYMRRFRKLIEPEFLVNKSAMEYFDSWGGRCYIYNSELSYQPTRNKNANAVNLHINMEIFTHDFNGKYIISRAEIKNAKTLGVSLVGVFTDPDSIYTIFVYENNNT
ncbi:MAG: DUF6044 family protein [Spirochaetaceae bacterium]|nr:DUF6044 family protein [Spirochaetaceae bacterium]